MSTPYTPPGVSPSILLVGSLSIALSWPFALREYILPRNKPRKLENCFEKSFVGNPVAYLPWPAPLGTRLVATAGSVNMTPSCDAGSQSVRGKSASRQKPDAVDGVLSADTCASPIPKRPLQPKYGRRGRTVANDQVARCYIRSAAVKPAQDRLSVLRTFAPKVGACTYVVPPATQAIPTWPARYSTSPRAADETGMTDFA